MDSATLSNVGTWGRNTLGNAVIGCTMRGTGWFMSSEGPKRLSPSAWARLVDRIAATGFASREKRFTALDAESRRLFLSAAGWLCDQSSGRLCPDCQDERLLAIVGIANVAELERAK